MRPVARPQVIGQKWLAKNEPPCAAYIPAYQDNATTAQSISSRHQYGSALREKYQSDTFLIRFIEE